MPITHTMGVFMGPENNPVGVVSCRDQLVTILKTAVDDHDRQRLTEQLAGKRDDPAVELHLQFWQFKVSSQ